MSSLEKRQEHSLSTFSLDEDVSFELYHDHKKPNNASKKIFYDFMACIQCCCWKPAFVVTKFAFNPPTTTYTLVATNKLKNNRIPIYELQLLPRFRILERYMLVSLVPSEQLKNIKAYFIHPSHTERLACYYMTWFNKNEARFVVLRCQMNASDLGMHLSLTAYLAWRLSCDVFEFDYSGYGNSSGKPSTTNIYKDVMAAYNFLTKELNVNPSKRIVFGQSLGTVPAIYLASSGVKLAGLIVEGVFIDTRIPLIRCPTLVIHGGLDDTTFIEHAENFFGLCKTLLPALIIPDGGHGNLFAYRAYWNRLEIFFCFELGGKYEMPYYQHCGLGCSSLHDCICPEEEDFPKHLGLSYPFKKSKLIK